MISFPHKCTEMPYKIHRYQTVIKDTASHPRFPYWGFNMKQWHQLLLQANIYMQQHTEGASLTVDQMRSRIGQFSAEQLMKRLQHYEAKVQG